MPVAPHENQEIDMVLSGNKPLATIEVSKQPESFRTACKLVRQGILQGVVIKSTESLRGEVIIVLPENFHLIAEYRELLANGVKQFGIKEYHRRMGAMFGYSKADVEDFINADINCECSKCRGY